MNKKITLLYVDDEPLNLMLFEANLDTRFNVLTAESGTLGLELLEQNPDIKIILSDMKMPKMNGLEFVKAVRTRHAGIICIILTGYEITPDIQDALDSGIINKYFTKPYTMEEIEEALDQALESL